MKNSLKKITSIMLIAVLLLTAVPLADFVGLELPKLSKMFTVKAEATTSYNVGDIIEFGSYPQSEVTDSAILSALNSLSLDWISYGYYSGGGNYGTMTTDGYAKYADVVYNGLKYRAIKFSQYRPYYCHGYSKISLSFQDDNGYYIDTIYWFKYEPIQWRVLDPNEGLVMSEICLDSQAYSNTIYKYNDEYYNSTSYKKYANDYTTSSIRVWLNDNFYNTAFISTEKEKIIARTLDNSSISSMYNSGSTTDNVFLPSYNEVLNSEYGFSTNPLDVDTARRAESTDYAKSQGSWRSTDYPDNAWWYLRSPGPDSLYTSFVLAGGDIAGGDIRDFDRDVDCTFICVRPALRVNLSELTDIYNMGEETYSFENFGDSDSKGGHCFGMSITSSAYHIGKLDITSVGGNKTDDVYALSKTSKVKEPICYYQERQSVELIKAANVAGGMLYETYDKSTGKGYINISSDWAEIINYVENHNYDNKGALQIVYQGKYDYYGTAKSGGHAVNFLRYEEVNGQQRIYVYDNNFPDIETYFYKNSNGEIVQAPYSTIDIYINSMALTSVEKYFDAVEGFDISRYIYADAETVRIEGAYVHPMACNTDGGMWVMYEIPETLTEITVIPLENNAEFVYLDNSYSFGSVTSKTVGIFTIPTSSPGEIGSGAKAEFTIINGTAQDTAVTIKNPSTTSINYGDSIILHADVALPAGAKVVWEASNDNFSYSVSADGKTCTISPESSGNTTFTAYVIDANGNRISEPDTQEMTSNAGFFQKIIAFFKKLFGLTKTIPQIFNGIR